MMKNKSNPQKIRYAKPKVVSKVVQFMTNTFTAVMLGPQREEPKRPPVIR
jgi:hypothetical protein